MTGIQYQTFSAFHATLKTLVAPEGLAEELIPIFRSAVASALADLQTFLPWLRDYNVSFYTKGEVNEFCSASIFQGPVGKATQLFAYKPGKDCERYHYQKVSTSEIDCWMGRQRCICPPTTPASIHIYDSPYCNYVIAGEAACSVPYLTGEEDDCRFKSLDDDDRIFAVGPDYKVYAAPRFPCQYLLCLQWQGIKRSWADSDLVPIDQQLQDAVVHFVEEKISRKERTHDAADAAHVDYQGALRVLKFRYTDEQEPEKKRDCTAAIAELQAKFLPIYETAVYGPGSAGAVVGGGSGIILGQEVFQGSGAPPASLVPHSGVGLYIDVDTGDLYKFFAGVWH